MPSSVVNRLAAAGLLVLAINELPDPQADLLESSEQLCNYLRRQARPDGSVACADKPVAEAADAASYAGLALYALMRSEARRPAAWKTDLVRKARRLLPALVARPQEHGMRSWLTAACTEAYLASKDQSCADFVFEMNDWLCGLQYPLDAQHERTWGGFKGWADGTARRKRRRRLSRPATPRGWPTPAARLARPSTWTAIADTKVRCR